MYAYTARAGSSCQHIRASCRQCATSRLRSIAPRFLRQSSLLSPNLTLTRRSYSSETDPLSAWLNSVKSKKRSEPQQLTPSSEGKPPKSASKSEASKPAAKDRTALKQRKLERIQRKSGPVPTTQSKEEDLVHALKTIANALAKSKGIKLDGSSSTLEPALPGSIKQTKGKKQPKSPDAVKIKTSSPNIKQGRVDIAESALTEGAHLDISPSELASALGPRKGTPGQKRRRERRASERLASGVEGDKVEETVKEAKTLLVRRTAAGVAKTRDVAGTAKMAEQSAKRAAKELALEDFRAREARRAYVKKPMIVRVSGNSRVPVSADSVNKKPKNVGPLLQKMYDMTNSVATTRAQRLLLEFLEKNHDLLGDHGDKLVDAQRRIADLSDAILKPVAAKDDKLNHTLLETYQTLEQAMKPTPKKTESLIPGKMSGKGIVGEISASELNLKPIDVPQPPVPGVVYGLDRVLFNPGVYQLRDEHSKVYNFDPYLETITPVKEFDFSALKEYITSSRDTALINIATQENTKYTGSTSSMTSALAHFHYLLSKWRPINMNHLSRGFPDPLTSFSAFQREPTGIFLRWRDGVYAIDANKEFDSANVLMYLGKSMEKFLTAERDVYEKFRKDQSHQLTAEEKDTPESYHYTTMGDFLMRSQLDAYDPRLPGTGMFDLKTRAVVSIRKDATDFEPGLGYEIRKRKGEFESFEREYYDLCRAAFMKYSLQARMGRMDGIFVAFHNIERIFGFQYLPIGAMDEAIHGTTDTTLGDQEFKVSVSMLNKALDIFTEKFPKQSLQIDFETRPINANKDDCFMYIMAQPATEEKIKSIQERNLEKIQEYERKVVGLDSKQTAQFLIDEANKETQEAELMDDAERLENAIEHPLDPHNAEILKAAVEKMNEHDTATENAVHKALEMVEQRLQEEGELAIPAENAEVVETSSGISAEAAADSSAELGDDGTSWPAPVKAEAPVKTKAQTQAEAFAANPIHGLKVQVRNFVNGREVLRVENLTAKDNWEVKYSIETMTHEQAVSRYKAMAARKFLVHVTRKRKGLEDVKEGKGSAHQNMFLGAISEAVRHGKEYRAQMDRLDAERGLTSLADHETFEPIKAEDAVEVRTGGLAVEDKPAQRHVEEVVTKEEQEAAKDEESTRTVKEEVKQETPEVETVVETTQSEAVTEEVVSPPKEEAKPEAAQKEVEVKVEKPKEETETAEKPWWLL